MFKDYIQDKPQPTLKAIAEVFEVPAQRIYSIAKQPVAGMVYDARVYNWDAISRFIEKRIGKEGDKYATVEEVYDAAIAVDEVLATQDKRRGPRAGGSAKVMIDLGEGKTMPARRKEVKVGDVLTFKKDADTTSYEVIYVTDTHIALKNTSNTYLTCLSNWTFNQQFNAFVGGAEAEAAE